MWVAFAIAAHAANQDVACATDDLLAALGTAGNGDTITLIDSGTCDLGGAGLVLDERVGILTAAGQTPTITGNQDPLIRVLHGDSGPLTLQGFTLTPAANASGIFIGNDEVLVVDVTVLGSPSTGTGISVAPALTGVVLDGVWVSDFMGTSNNPGGLMVGASSIVDLSDCSFVRLTSTRASAVDVQSAATATIVRSNFCDNSGPVTLLVDQGIATVSASTFLGNQGGTALQVGSSADLTLRFNHFVANDGALSVLNPGGAITVDSNVFLDQVGAAFSSVSVPSPTYNLWYGNASDVADAATTGTNALFVDPLPVGWDGNATNCDQDFRPQAGSPVIDAGNPLFEDAPGDPADIGAFGGPDRAADWDDGDGDGDGYLTDCDDRDPTRATTFADLCDALDLDEDCSGVGDDDPATFVVFHPDVDGDGFGDRDPALALLLCPEDAPLDYVEDAADCNDDAASSWPGALEACDHADNDCNARVDDVGVLPRFGPDIDRDGAGTDDGAVDACFRTEIDQAPADEPDCDDANTGVRPDVPEACDGLDTDCDAKTPDDSTPRTWYRDGDGDGHGDGAQDMGSACDAPAVGAVATPSDCDDTNIVAHPGGTEICNTLDDDCDGLIDDADIDLFAPVFYPDADGDGLGDVYGLGWPACAVPVGWVEGATDCDDTLDDPTGSATTFWPDLDGDGYGDPTGETWEACVSPGPGWVDNDLDCNDGLSTSNPGLAEVVGDGVDNDCDGQVDETIQGGSERLGVAPVSSDGGCGCAASANPTSLFGLAMLMASGRFGRGARRRAGPCTPGPTPADARRR